MTGFHIEACLIGVALDRNIVSIHICPCVRVFICVDTHESTQQFALSPGILVS